MGMLDEHVARGSMHLQVTETIGASRSRVFAALTNSVALWWGKPYLENEKAENIILEPRLGGRLYECWSEMDDDRDGALLGTVTAIKRPEMIRFEGPFGMINHVAHGVVTIRLHSDGPHTQIHLEHCAVGLIDDNVRQHFQQGWHDLLHRLKSLIELHHTEGLKHDPSLS